jgi:hypothetical protein
MLRSMIRWIINIGFPLCILWLVGLLAMLLIKPWFMENTMDKYMMAGALVSIITLPCAFYKYYLVEGK